MLAISGQRLGGIEELLDADSLQWALNWQAELLVCLPLHRRNNESTVSHSAAGPVK